MNGYVTMVLGIQIFLGAKRPEWKLGAHFRKIITLRIICNVVIFERQLRQL